MRRFALRFIHSHSDATSVFRNAFREVVSLTTSGNRVRHIVTSQDDATRTLITTDREQGILDLVMHYVLIFVFVDPSLSACERRSCYSHQHGSTPEVYNAINLQENVCGAALRMDKP